MIFIISNCAKLSLKGTKNTFPISSHRGPKTGVIKKFREMKCKIKTHFLPPKNFLSNRPMSPLECKQSASIMSNLFRTRAGVTTTNGNRRLNHRPELSWRTPIHSFIHNSSHVLVASCCFIFPTLDPKRCPPKWKVSVTRDFEGPRFDELIRRAVHRPSFFLLV